MHTSIQKQLSVNLSYFLNYNIKEDSFIVQGEPLQGKRLCTHTRATHTYITVNTRTDIYAVYKLI